MNDPVREKFAQYFINEVLIKNEETLNNSFFPCKTLPINYNNNKYLLTNSQEDCIIIDDEPYPTIYLTENYGSSLEEYRDSGKTSAKGICECVKTYLEKKQSISILDWGCASGRVLRFLNECLDCDTDIYGCDINANHISWCQKHLNNKGIFTQCTTLPHLPFQDNSFDVVYGISIFTHISELIDMWIMELKRIIRKNGLLIITLHDEAATNQIMSGSSPLLRDVIIENYGKILPKNYERFFVGDKSPFGNFMFFSDNNIQNTFGKVFHIKEKLTNTPLARSIGDFQTTYILENSLK